MVEMKAEQGLTSWTKQAELEEQSPEELA